MTTVPSVGNVAVDSTPVPPKVWESIPVTAADWERSMAPNEGMPPAAGTVRLWYGAPASVT